MNSSPGISCLCVTRSGRIDELPVSVSYFARQTVVEKELIIIHDGDGALQKTILSITAQYGREKIIVERAPDGLTLGDLRNLAVEKADYPLICQWDDDDWNHPRRLEIQRDHLLERNGDFCFFTDQLHYYKEQNVFYWDDWRVEPYPGNLIPGTLMGYRDRMPAYPQLSLGEDTPPLETAAERGLKLIPLERKGFLYIYVYDSKNAWDYNHHAAISSWKGLGYRQLNAERDALRKHLCDYNLPLEWARFPHEKGVLEMPLR